KTYPSGLLFRVLPPDAPMPSLDEILAENQRLLASFDLSYPWPTLEASYAVAMHIRYVRTWDILARALRDAGRLAEARLALEIRDWLGLKPGARPPGER